MASAYYEGADDGKMCCHFIVTMVLIVDGKENAVIHLNK
jgi:hypothetical protein